jgi:hypothetical protein
VEPDARLKEKGGSQDASSPVNLRISSSLVDRADR